MCEASRAFATFVALAGCSSTDNVAPTTPGAGAGRDEVFAVSMPDAANASDTANGTDSSAVYAKDDRIHHVVIAGQSLALGATGSPALSTADSPMHLMFDTGLIGPQPCPGTAAECPGPAGFPAWSKLPAKFVPLREGLRGNVETISSGFTDLVDDAVGAAGPYQVLASIDALGGRTYQEIKKGTWTYNDALVHMKYGHSIATAMGKKEYIPAVLLVHGESDCIQRNARYDEDLKQWQSDFERDGRIATGQTEAIPLFESQVSAIGPCEPVILQWRAASQAPDKIILVGPKYQLPYTGIGPHLTNEGYRWLGEYYAKAYRRVVLDGRRWTPLQPHALSCSGATLTLKLDVPVPPLVIDNDLVSAVPGSGFTFDDGTPKPPTVTSVQIAAADTLTITLSRTPAVTDGSLGYAVYHLTTPGAGPSTGLRGNLRDSDATPSRHGYKLHNWLIHFQMKCGT